MNTDTTAFDLIERANPNAPLPDFLSFRLDTSFDSPTFYLQRGAKKYGYDSVKKYVEGKILHRDLPQVPPSRVISAMLESLVSQFLAQSHHTNTPLIMRITGTNQWFFYDYESNLWTLSNEPKLELKKILECFAMTVYDEKEVTAVKRDENGEPVPKYKTDNDGNVILNSDNEPVVEKVKGEIIYETEKQMVYFDSFERCFFDEYYVPQLKLGIENSTDHNYNYANFPEKDQSVYVFKDKTVKRLRDKSTLVEVKPDPTHYCLTRFDVNYPTNKNFDGIKEFRTAWAKSAVAAVRDELKTVDDSTEGRLLQEAENLFDLIAWGVVNNQWHQHHKFINLYGTGGTGKSTYGKLMSLLVSEHNTFTLNSVTDIDSRFGITPEAYGKILWYIPDNQHPLSGNTSKFMALTGGNPITLEQKGVSAFSFLPRTTLFIVSNKMPIKSGDAGAINRRIVPIRLARTHNEVNKKFDGEYVPNQYAAYLRYLLEDCDFDEYSSKIADIDNNEIIKLNKSVASEETPNASLFTAVKELLTAVGVQNDETVPALMMGGSEAKIQAQALKATKNSKDHFVPFLRYVNGREKASNSPVRYTESKDIAYNNLLEVLCRAELEPNGFGRKTMAKSLEELKTDSSKKWCLLSSKQTEHKDNCGGFERRTIVLHGAKFDDAVVDEVRGTMLYYNGLMVVGGLNTDYQSN